MSRVKKLTAIVAEALGPIAAMFFTWAMSIHDVALAGLACCLAMIAAGTASNISRTAFAHAKEKPRWSFVFIGVVAFCVVVGGFVLPRNNELQMAGFMLAFTTCLMWWALSWAKMGHLERGK